MSGTPWRSERAWGGWGGSRRAGQWRFRRCCGVWRGWGLAWIFMGDFWKGGVRLRRDIRPERYFGDNKGLIGVVGELRGVI
jgi:hypothetical protein